MSLTLDFSKILTWNVASSRWNTEMKLYCNKQLFNSREYLKLLEKMKQEQLKRHFRRSLSAGRK